jgi:hypothetical protein
MKKNFSKASGLDRKKVNRIYNSCYVGNVQIGTVGYKLNGEDTTMLQLMNDSGAALTF